MGLNMSQLEINPKQVIDVVAPSIVGDTLGNLIRRTVTGGIEPQQDEMVAKLTGAVPKSSEGISV